MMSPARHLEEAERAALERHVEASYRSFLEAVAAGRNKGVTDIEPLAGGRVWSGRDAAARALVDELGGFDVALSRMRQRLGRTGERAEPVVAGGTAVGDLMSLIPNPMRTLGRGLRSAGVTELVLAAGQSRERVWAWCELAEREE